jgi:hypothetical protein
MDKLDRARARDGISDPREKEKGFEFGLGSF